MRLDAATVSEIARRLKATWGGTAKAAALRWAGEVVAQMTTDESAPPRLSDWVAACEGTALGEPQVIPSWELRANPAGDFAHVDFIEAIGAADVVVHSYVKPIGQYDDGHREARTRCHNPAELRAALEALAKEGS